MPLAVSFLCHFPSAFAASLARASCPAVSGLSSAPKGRVRLQPENAALEPNYAKHVQILGRVVGVFREL